MPILTPKQLTNVSKNLLKAAGASDEEAETVTNLLVKANLAGVDSHGVLPNLTSYIQGIRKRVIKSGAKTEIVREGPATALINGNWGFGQVTCSKAMQIAIKKAQETGVGVVGIFNCNHIGRLADYSLMAAEKGMIGFIVVNSDPCVAPFGGRKAVLSTNPLCYAVPTGSGNPIVVDFATSVVAEGKVRAALYKGEKVPAGWIVDAEGRPTTNPADLYEPPLPPVQNKLAGALLPAGGHKGYGLALIIEILAGALTGTGCGEEVVSGLTNGVFIIVLRIDKFVPPEEFATRVQKLVKNIRNSPKAVGSDKILIPGEPEFAEHERRSTAGIKIPESSWEDLVKTCKEYGLNAEELLRT